MNKAIISRYYDYTLPFYAFFWHRHKSHALHYGLWEKDTKHLTEALLNTNVFMAKQAKIKKGQLVLDAGCGIGGSSIWLAQNIGAQVVGITISKKQLTQAKNLTQKKDLNGSVKFYLKDYLKTGFPQNSFDVVWAIESVCHATNKKDFLKEAYRILKKGGRLIIADGFLYHQPKNRVQSFYLKAFLNGLALPNLVHFNSFKKDLKEVKFKKIKLWDKTSQILPSSKIAFRRTLVAYPISLITERLKITSPILTKNNLAGLVQYPGIKSGLSGYGIFYAEK